MVRTFKIYQRGTRKMYELTFEKLRKTNDRRSIEWGDHVPILDDVEFCAIELGGETGELLNVIKKLLRYKHGMRGGISLAESRQSIEDELADVVICVDRLASCFDIDLGLAVRRKFNKTSDKQKLKTIIENE